MATPWSTAGRVGAGASRHPLVQVRDMLFPSDLSSESDAAFEHARFLAAAFGSRLTLYHAVELPDPKFAHWAFDRAPQIWHGIEQAARTVLERKAQQLEVSHDVLVERTSSAPRSLLALIAKTQPDLTVMATHGREGIGHFLLGSVTERVFQHSFRPVLCVRPREHGGVGLPYKRIVVPTDMSVVSRLAFPMAELLGRWFGAEIVAVHVTHDGWSGGGVEIPTESGLWKFCESSFPGLDVTAQVHRGRPWERIVETARVERADLIVMATRGHDRIADRIVGTTTERVVRHAPCPVMVA